LVLSQNAGTVFASAAYAGSPIYAPSTSISKDFTITESHHVGSYLGQGIYTGSTFFWTANPSSSTATLTLSATIEDNGACHGDIRTANATFAFRNGDGTVTPIPSAQKQPVGLVDPANPFVGSATAVVQFNIGNSKFETYELAVIIGGNYVLNDPRADTPISVIVPGVANQIRMAGSQLDLHAGSVAPASSGLLATAMGLVPDEPGYLNISGVVTYAPKGKTLMNPQGKIFLEFNSYNKPDGSVDTVMHRYRITSNSIAGLSKIANGPPAQYQFTAKANVVEVTPGGTVNIDGGATMQIKVEDPVPGISPLGSAAVSVISKSGTTWLSSAWSETQTVLKPLVEGLASGN
jgi:hypothetical protein